MILGAEDGPDRSQLTSCVSMPRPGTGLPGSTKRVTPGKWSSRWTGAGRSASRSIPPIPTPSTPAFASDGVRRTTDGGRTWIDCALPEPGVFSLAVSAADGAVYAGTEPSALYRSDDRGETWRELTSLLDLPSRPTWSFPPRPWTSHVRWIAPSPHEAELDPRRHRAGRVDALDRRRRDVGRPPARCTAGRPLTRVASAGRRAGLRGGRRRVSLERRRRARPGIRRTRAGTETTRGRSPSIPTTRSSGTSRRAPVPTPRTAAAIRRR